MVKFNDKSSGDYKNLENHIVKMMRLPRLRLFGAGGVDFARAASGFVNLFWTMHLVQGFINKVC